MLNIEFPVCWLLFVITFVGGASNHVTCIRNFNPFTFWSSFLFLCRFMCYLMSKGEACAPFMAGVIEDASFSSFLQQNLCIHMTEYYNPAPNKRKRKGQKGKEKKNKLN